MEQRDYLVASDDNGTRLDRFIRRQHDGINQGRIEKLLRSGGIRVNGDKAKSSTRLLEGQIVTMPCVVAIGKAAPKPVSIAPAPETVRALQNALISQGDGWIAINKPSGLASQGGTKTNHHIDGALAAAFPGPEKPRLVHRLDRDTSGVMLVATNLAAARMLARGFENRRFCKIYLALVLGAPKPKIGTIDAPLIKAQSGMNKERIIVDMQSGASARTDYSVLSTAGGKVSLVALKPLTGRTHQLRAHMTSIGCPILGDGKYGGRDAFPNEVVTRLCLHAAYLELDNGQAIRATIPDDLHPVMKFFGINPDEALSQVVELATTGKHP